MHATRIALSLLVITAGTLFGVRHNTAFGQGEVLAAKARDILKANCLECHGDKFTKAGIKVLDHQVLVSKAVSPGSAEDSLLYQVITANDESAMPPSGRTRLNAEQIAVIKAWIAAGAPAFPTGAAPVDSERGFGMESILNSILQDSRRIAVADRKFMRYFSIAHLMNAGASKEELELQREALTKAINHLSWQTELVRPVPIETTRTVLRIDIRKLGWDKQPYKQVKGGKFVANSGLNIFDLALLEYPYGVVSHQSATYIAVAQEFLAHAAQVRPIPYVRADWFVSTVTQPPLYEDFLQLPRTIKELENILGVDRDANVANFKAVRGGVVQSGVSRNNRAMERHDTKYGSDCVSFDFQSSIGADNILNDPINFKPAGGEMIFTLPNGLQAYFITNGKGERIEFAPTSIVVDENASDRTVRNGLSCMRCHDRGMRPFTDVVRPTLQKLGNASEAGMNVDAVLKLYPEQSKLDALVKKDEEKFLSAMEQLLGKPQGVEPLKPVAKGFLEVALKRSQAGSELGLNESKRLNAAIESLQIIKLGFAALIADGRVPRDAWQENFPTLVRRLRLGVPVIALDGLTGADSVPSPAPAFEIEVKTNRGGNLSVFGNNEEIVIFVKPTKDVFIEVIGTSVRGRKVVLAPATTKVKAGQQFRFPPEGKTLKAKGGAGKETITVFASQTAFSDGELLRGEGVSDRIVHRFQVNSRGSQVEMQFSPNPFQTIKKTITIESR